MRDHDTDRLTRITLDEEVFPTTPWLMASTILAMRTEGFLNGHSSIAQI
jgi:hypothetical protein